MESWVLNRLKTLLPALQDLTSEEREQIAAICEAEVQALRDRGIALVSLKRPLRELRAAINEGIPLTEANSYQDKGETKHLALKYLTFTDDEWSAMSKPSEERFRARYEYQAFIRCPDEAVARARTLLQSSRWEEVLAALIFVTGRRLSEAARFAVFHEESLYTITFGGQRKTKRDRTYEIYTLLPANEVIAGWKRLRELRDFSTVEPDRISSSFGPQVKEVIVRTFSDLIEVPVGDKAHLITHVLRAVYPRLAIFYFLDDRTPELDLASILLGHIVTENGVVKSNYQSTLYYMTYKIAGEDGHVDPRQGVKLTEPGVKILRQLKEREKRHVTPEAEETTRGGTKLALKKTTKPIFDDEMRAMKCKTADEAVRKLVEDHRIYRQLLELLGDGEEVQSLVAVLQEAVEIKLEQEPTPLRTLQAALADKRRFRSSYDKRTEAATERDYASMSMEELKKARTPEASLERWRRAVDMIVVYNDQAVVPEMRVYINAAVVKLLVGGRGVDIGKYLQEQRAEELKAHHEKWKLKPGINYGRSNIRERILGESAEEETTEEEAEDAGEATATK